jgi:hypothetical protein
VTICKACGKSNRDNAKTCVGCGAPLSHAASASRAEDPQPVPKTSQVSEAKEARSAPYGRNDIHRFTEFFERQGFEATSPKVVRGLSGIEHRFDLYALRDHFNIVLDVISAPKAVGPEKIVGFFAKVFDTRPSKGVLIAMPKLDEEAQKLSALYGVETIAAEQTDEILAKLPRLLERPAPQAKPEVTVQELSPSLHSLTEPEGLLEASSADEILRRARSHMARIIGEADQQVS